MKPMNIALMVFVMLVSFMPTVSADSTFRCEDNTTLREYSEIVIDNDTITIEENTTCEYGCSADLNRCRPAPFQENIWGLIIVGIVLIALSLSYYFGSAVSVFIIFVLTTFSLLIGALDVFGETWRLIFWLLAILSLGAVGYLAMKAREWEEYEEPVADDRLDTGRL